MDTAMTTRVILPETSDLTDLVPLMPDVDSVPAPLGATRPRRAIEVSSSSMRTFVAAVGIMSGCVAGLLGRTSLAALGLEGAVPAPNLGFFGALWGLSLCFLFQRLMERARASTIRVKIEGEPKSFPIRRRHEVVRRAAQYLFGLSCGFAASVALGLYALSHSIPAAQVSQLRLTPDLRACLLVAGISAATLAFGEWTLRLTRKEGHADQGAFVQVPAMITMGLVLAGFLA